MPQTVNYWVVTLNISGGPQLERRTRTCRWFEIFIVSELLFNCCQGAYNSLQRSWLFVLPGSKNHESQAKCLSGRSWFFSPPTPFFFFFPRCLPPARTVQWVRRGYLRLRRCHLAWGSTCAPEVLILILNRLDTKTNKLSSLHQTGLKNYGRTEGYAITAANLRSPKLAPFPVPPATLYFKYWGAESVCMCVFGLVFREGARGEAPPHSCTKVRQHQGD